MRPLDEEAEGNRERTELNLLGEVDSESGESRRNENVQLTLIDNNVLKEINIRMGTTATIVREFQATRGYFGTEFGNPATRPMHLSQPAGRDFHASLYETHGNSVFSARSFFQVGSVKPATSNDYGVQMTLPLLGESALSVDLNQQRNRGNVNGNVLVPLPEERVPLATDPELRALVSRVLGSYPDEAPNRPDINPRAHNTNAPQVINNDIAGGRYDLPLGENDRLALDYRFRKQIVDAFQLVKGQNPNTTTGSHDGRFTWNRSWSPQTSTDFSAGFRRTTSLIVQDETAFGPLVFMGRQLQSLGGTSSVPYDRVQNFFRYAGTVSTTRGNHRVVAGFGLMREQLNGIESSGHLGMVMFTANFRARHDDQPAPRHADPRHAVDRHDPSRLSALANAVLCRGHLEGRSELDAGFRAALRAHHQAGRGQRVLRPSVSLRLQQFRTALRLRLPHQAGRPAGRVRHSFRRDLHRHVHARTVQPAW